MMKLPPWLELFVEKRSPTILAAISTIAWKYYSGTVIPLIVGKPEIIYQTLVMYATIVVALLATFKAIIVTVDGHEGVSLIRSNRGMFRRFLNYMFSSICMNMLFSVISFVYLALDVDINAGLWFCAFVFIAMHSVFSLVRVLVLFRFIIQRPSP